MANFVVSLLDSNGDVDITANGSTITIKDHSNYDEAVPEAGHAQTDFSLFRKVKIVNPDNTVYLYSSIGDGDESTPVANGSSLPITTINTYSTGDGVYEAVLYTLPTWKTATAYSSSTYVYSSTGIIYKSLTSSNTAVLTDTNSWSVVTDIDTISTKYRYYVKFAVDCDIKDCWAQAVLDANCDSENNGCRNDLCYNSHFIKAARLDLVRESIDTLVGKGAWDEVTNAINFGKSLCCCN